MDTGMPRLEVEDWSGEGDGGQGRVESQNANGESGFSPPAMAVVATEAISQGASPATMIPSRSELAMTNCDASHDRAGSTMIPVATATTRGRHSAPSRRSAARLDGERRGEDQDGDQDIDALVRGQPHQRRLDGEANERGHEHTEQLRITMEQ